MFLTCQKIRFFKVQKFRSSEVHDKAQKNEKKFDMNQIKLILYIIYNIIGVR